VTTVQAPPAGSRTLRPDDLCGLLDVPLTAEQLAAATAPLEPGVIVAGAGSGKTTVMAGRVVWLVATGQVEIEQVLGLTFTNKAAGELASRVRAALARAAAVQSSAVQSSAVHSSAVQSSATQGAELAEVPPQRGLPAGEPGGGQFEAGEPGGGEPTILTYHAYAGRLIAEHGLRIGIEPQARLLADATRFQLAHRAIRRAPGPFRWLTKPVWMLVADVVALDAELAEHLVDPAALREHDRSLVVAIEALPKPVAALRDAAEAAQTRLELVELVEAFRAEKRRLDALDFGDQVLLGARLAENRAEVGASERDRYRVVLLDEYQDTSVGQRRMLVGLYGGGHPVTAVGDPCQGIYGWRGASVTNLDRFPEHFAGPESDPAPSYSLSENQRSGGLLLRLANAVSAVLRDVHHGVVELRPRPEVATAGSTSVALLPTYAEEMQWLAEGVQAALDAGTPAPEIAVLVRVRSDFAAVRAALVARDIPVEVVGLGGLLALPEVADVVAMLQVLDDPTSNAALVRLLTGPRWRIGPRDLAHLGRRAGQLARGPVDQPVGAHDAAGRAGADPDAALAAAVAGTDPSEVVALADALEQLGSAPYSAQARARFATFAAELRALRQRIGEPLLDVVHRVVTTIGLDVELAADPHVRAGRRGDALGSFLDQAATFVDLDGEASVGTFLAYLRAAEQHERGLDNSGPSGRDAVQVMTVHKAKGLEWDVVAVPGLVETVFPSSRGRDRWTTCGHVLPHPLRGDAADLPVVPDWSKRGIDSFKADCKTATLLEERRLGYVAFTRARRHLIASGHWWGPEQKKPRGPSVFLTELRAHCAAGAGTVAAWAPGPPAGETNPALLAGRWLAWPVELEPLEWQRRHEAATAVRQDLAELAAGQLPLAVDTGLSAADAAAVAGWDADAAVLLAEVAAQRRSRSVVELPRSLSASQLVRLHADPNGLARELARPMPRRPAPAARRGTRFHAWVESSFDQRPLLEPDDLPGASDAELVDDTDLALLQAAFARTPYAALQPTAVEAPFELVLAGRVVRGRIDAVYATGTGFEVVDWKTGNEAADPLQLAVYRLAWAEMNDLPVSAVSAAFLYVRTGTVERPGDLPDRAALTAILTGGAQAGLSS